MKLLATAHAPEADASKNRQSSLFNPPADKSNFDLALWSSHVALLPLLLGLVVGACGSHSTPALSIDRLVFITIDTLRADHLPSFGYPIDTAPFLESLAKRSVSFKQAFAHSATTGPSHASMFTSLYPIQHRVQDNGQKLDKSFVTLAEVLADSGYTTAAFVSGNAHFGRSKIAQGFQHYDQPARQSRNNNGKLMLYRPADQTTASVIRWFESRPPGERFFLWVHYYDPHRPLRPPAQYLEDVAPRNRKEMYQLENFLRRQHHSDFRLPQQLQQIISYDAEIRFVDSQIERLFSALHAQEPGVKTLSIITSDHGQGLANHDWFGHHVHIYNEQLHVPLLFHFSTGHMAGRVVEDQLVEHVDLPVTILDLLGETSMSQIDQIQGKSLVPVLVGDPASQHRRFAFGERRRTYGPVDRQSQEPGERYALQSLEAKYLWFTEGPDEFYDLRDDPYETRDIIDQPSPEKDELQATLINLVAALRSDGQAETVDEETLEKLRALGYLR